MNTPNSASFSRSTDKTLSLLFKLHPLRTALGVMLGLSLAMLAALFSPLLARSAAVAVSKVHDWQWIPLGIVIAHLPTLLGYISTRPSGNERIDDALRLIDKCSVSEAQRKVRHQELIEAAILNVRVDASSRSRISSLRSDGATGRRFDTRHAERDGEARDWAARASQSRRLSSAAATRIAK